MQKEKNTNQKQKQEEKSKEKMRVNPGEIKGKIEVPDTRERKDGPGGN